MKKKVASLLTAIAVLASGAASMACMVHLLEEPRAPKNLIDKKNNKINFICQPLWGWFILIYNIFIIICIKNNTDFIKIKDKVNNRKINFNIKQMFKNMK